VAGARAKPAFVVLVPVAAGAAVVPVLLAVVEVTVEVVLKVNVTPETTKFKLAKTAVSALMIAIPFAPIFAAFWATLRL